MINLFPYTDAHELNLDWVIEQVKANDTKVKDLTNTVINMHFDFDSKADKATTYTKTEVNTLLAAKADTSSLATVATSGSYTDLVNTPTIPAAQVNSDWDAVSGVAQILNKPTIPAAQVNSDWDALSGVAQILNKPTSLSGYGITDAYTQLEVDTMIGSLQTQITQDEVLTKTVTMTIPANQTGGTFLTSAVFDNTYKLIAFNVNYNDDFYYYTSSHAPYFSFITSSRQIALRNSGGNVGDTVARTLEFNVSYKKA